MAAREVGGVNRDSWTVGQDAIRPAGPPDACCYCGAAYGDEHKAGCVMRQRTVVCEVTIKVVRTVPENWDQEMIEFHMNESSWCFNNIVGELEEAIKRAEDGCCLLCSLATGRYLGEATADDEDAFQLFVADIKS
jgi:hypothetical protein